MCGRINHSFSEANIYEVMMKTLDMCLFLNSSNQRPALLFYIFGILLTQNKPKQWVSLVLKHFKK